MTIPTEPIGSIPRPRRLIEAFAITDGADPRLDLLDKEAIRDRVLEAAQDIPVGQLGTTDDCGFSPFCDDISTTRDSLFTKIRVRMLGTALASEILGGG
jgi:5-methyltetrahydropteroyltriglutamate--homocysteine methyltransferase